MSFEFKISSNDKKLDGVCFTDKANQPSAGIYQTLDLQTRIQNASKTGLQFLDKLFMNRFVQLPNSSFTYAASDDFGITVKKLLFPKPTDSDMHAVTGLQNNHITNNMLFFGEKFGFEVIFSKNTYCLRDCLIKCKDKIYVPSDSKNISLAIDRNQSRSLFFSDSASFLTNHSFLFSKPGICVQEEKLLQLAHKDLVAFFDQSKELVPFLHFYMEGGNHYVTTNKLGKKVVLVGEDVLYITLNQWRRDGVFNKTNIEKAMPDFEKKLTSDSSLLLKTLQEMYVQGLIVPGKGKEKGFVTAEEISNVVQLAPLTEKSYQQMAENLEYYKPLNLSELQKNNGIKIAAEYLVQKEGIKSFFPKAFGVDELCFVPKLDYHLDVFLCPAPKGGIYVQDYSFTEDLLEKIFDQKESLGLTSLDLIHLDRYRETAKKLNRELGELNKKVKEELEKAGFVVIPAPGLFYDADTTSPTFNLNFLNARTGWSPKTNSYYYLTMGASVGDNLGQVLMSSFEKFLKSSLPDIQVGFLGFDPNNEKDFSEGMSFLNRNQTQAGPHCFAFVMESSQNHVV